MASMQTLSDLYVDELKDLYSAETQILKALPKMAEAAVAPDLQQAFQMHLEQTKGHVQRLEQIFEAMGESPKGKKCKGIEGIVEEGEELIKMKPDADVLDAGLIASAQRVEHYEIAGYGTVRTFAQQLGENQAATLLQQTLEEESSTNEKLTKIATKKVNMRAASS